MKKNLKHLVKQLQDTNGGFVGGFASIRGGFTNLSTNSTKCSNARCDSSTNQLDCTNTHVCDATNQATCTNTGSCS